MHQSTLHCDFALPAEWEPQSAIMLTWPHAGTDWKPYLPEITDTYLELADIITRYEQLLVATPDVPATRYQLKKKLSAEQMSRVLLYEVESNDTWVRDHGPLTMVLRRKQNTWMVPYRILDFKFNGWGEKFRWEKDNAITLQLYYQAAFNADIENHQGFVLEGGSIESDGKGTLFTTSQCLLAPHRNQPLDHDSIDHLLLDTSVSDICEKYTFEYRNPQEMDDTVLYAEPTLQGNAAICKRQEGEQETQMNLELLFNAVIGGKLAE